jgi:predicted nucleic acid-binding protein
MEGQPEHLIEDAMTAASARVHQLTIATWDKKDFIHLQV